MNKPSNKQPTEPLSITHWFHRYCEGDSRAAEVLWDHFFPRLVQLAKQRCRAAPTGDDRADDAATSAIRILFRGAQEGRYQGIEHRDELWRLLIVATRRKLIDRYRAEQTAKRGGGVVVGSFEQDFAANTPTAETLAILDEDLQALLGLLRDDTLRQIALCKLEGYPNGEIAQQLAVSERTIERKLRLIREDWQRKLDERH